MFENLRRLRKEKNIKPIDLAIAMGLKTEAAYYKKETEAVPFTLKECRIVANLIGLPIEVIFFEDEISCEDKI